MADRSTLLAHIALGLSVHPENIAVEALGHILSSCTPALRALEDVLRKGGADVDRISEARTQASDEEGARPDLAGYDEDRVERVLVEAKFWAGLTERQPVAYLRRLPTNKPSALLFVAPANRFETLWTELSRRVTECDEFDMGPSVQDANLRSAPVGDERYLMLTSWKALLDRMASNASATGDSHTETDIRQLLGLTQRMDEEAFLPIRAEELGPAFPRRMLGLPSVIEAATGRGREEGWIDTNRLSIRATADSWGRYMRLGKDECAAALFGFSFRFWAKHGDTPLRIRLGGEWDNTMKHQELRRRLEPLRSEDPPGAIYEGDYISIPVHLPVGVEETAVIAAVVAQLERVSRMIDPHI